MCDFQHAKGQKLEEIHCVQRVRFCDWWLEQPDDLPQHLFVSDEKYFQIEEAPNPKNTGTWSKTNPHIIEGVKCQSSVKVLCFVVNMIRLKLTRYQILVKYLLKSKIVHSISHCKGLSSTLLHLQ